MLNLDLFCELAAAEIDSWRTAGVEANLHRSPADRRDKHAAWIIVVRGEAEAELILWDSGEGEFISVRPDQHEPLQEHLEAVTDSDLSGLLDRLRDAVRPTPEHL